MSALGGIIKAKHCVEAFTVKAYNASAILSLRSPFKKSRPDSENGRDILSATPRYYGEFWVSDTSVIPA